MQKDLSDWVDLRRIEINQKISELINKPYTIIY